MRGVELAEEKSKFVLYQYLLYFGKRKWFFVIIPLITTILIASAVYVLKNDKKYTGTALVFTGSINARNLTDPNNIKAKYKDLDDVFVSEKGQVKLTIKGDSKAAVKKQLHDITQDFNKDLNKNAKQRIEITSLYLTSLEKRIESLKKSVVSNNKKLDDEKLLSDEVENISDMMIADQDELTKADERANGLRSDIRLFEQPKVLDEKVTKKNNYLPESIAIGIILGLILTVALLVLLKYLGDGRRYFQHD
jgi:hypothetical protein